MVANIFAFRSIFAASILCRIFISHCQVFSEAENTLPGWPLLSVCLSASLAWPRDIDLSPLDSKQADRGTNRQTTTTTTTAKTRENRPKQIIIMMIRWRLVQVAVSNAPPVHSTGRPATCNKHSLVGQIKLITSRRAPKTEVVGHQTRQM